MNKRITEIDEYVQRAAKELFNHRLKDIIVQLQNCGGEINRELAMHQYSSCIKKEKTQNKIYKMPLIGKMIHRSKNHSKTYSMIISLMNNYKLDLINVQHMEWIMEHRDEVYNQYYREDFEKRVIKTMRLDADTHKKCNNNIL